MAHVNINLRLRPIRFAFLVNPNNSEQLLEVFRVNTCLWGGKFNPIIPIRKNKKGDLLEKENQIIKKYLDFFEPDFVIETEKNISKGLNFERVLSINSILKDEKEKYGQEFQYGQSVKGLYKYLYETEFKYKHILDPDSVSPPYKYNNIIYVETDKILPSDRFKNFIACNFGNFPDDEGLKYFSRKYEKFFHPVVKIFKPQSSYYLIDDFDQSPLDIGCKKLKVDFYNNEPSLFLLDAENNEDLIDFWNLRGVCSKIKAVPIQCIKEFSPYLKRFVKEHYPAPEINELKKTLEFCDTSKINRPVPIFSRSMPTSKKLEKLYKNHIQHHYDADIQSKWETIPDLKSSTDFLKNGHRPILEADSKEIDIKTDEKNPEISLSLLYPKTEKSGGCFLWANVITMQDPSNQTATVFPRNYRKNFINLNIVKDKFDVRLEWLYELEDPSSDRIQKELLSTTEGLVIFSHSKNSSENWVLADGTTVIKNWLQSNNKIKETKLSNEGRISQQIIHSLGFDGVSILANEKVINLLNNMSRKPLKSLQLESFEGEIKKIANNRKESFVKIKENLIKNKAIKLGMEIKCDKCNQWSWYPLKNLDYSLICDFCLKSYIFPDPNPKNKSLRWAYRVIGPFALPKYADGGYAVALSIRFFIDTIGGYNKRRSVMAPPSRFFEGKHFLDDKVTWSPGQKLEWVSGKEIETDFILLSQRPKHNKRDNTIDVIFGEAKSFGREFGPIFQTKDIDNMKRLAEAFSGSLFVFATMSDKGEMTIGEIEDIRELAEWGRREYNKETQTARALIIVLTGTELFAQSSLFTAWSDQAKKLEKQGKKEEARKYRKINEIIQNDSFLSLRAFAYLTQYLYLDIPFPKSK